MLQIHKSDEKIENAGILGSQYPTKMSVSTPPMKRCLWEEEKHHKKMSEDAEMLSYMRMMRQITEKMSTTSIKGKAEVIRFFNLKIDDLEWRAGIAPRYSYILNYPTFADKEFKTIEEVVDFITEFIKSDPILFDKEEYKYPTTSFIESEFEWYGHAVIDVDEDNVPPFRLTRRRIY